MRRRVRRWRCAGRGGGGHPGTGRAVLRPDGRRRDDPGGEPPRAGAGHDAGGALALAGRITARIVTPLVLMTYYNPIFSFGVAHFCEAAAPAGSPA